MEQIYNSSDLDAIFEKVLSDYPIHQGIVGIFIEPDILSTTQHYEFLDGLYRINEVLNYDIQQVILPPPASPHFAISDNEKMDALRRRVERDQLDGIRYNRVYFAIYTERPPESVIKAHDIWFDVEDGIGYTSRAVMTDYREPVYIHADLNSKGQTVLKDQYGNELKLTAEDLVPHPVDIYDPDKMVFANSMKGVIQRVLLDDELPKSELGERTPEILFSNKSLFLRMTTPPTVGDVLKSNFGYDKEDSNVRLAEETGFTENIAKGILDNKYPALLTIHLIAISKATNGDYEYWSDVHETRCKWLEFNRNTDGNR